jgi:hypothetical protein
MTLLEERRRALEDKYILDVERSFRTRSRRNHMLAEWVALTLGKKDVESYINEIEAFSVRSPRDDDLLQKIIRDFAACGVTADETTLREKMHDLLFDAAEALDKEDAGGHR